MFTPLTRFRSLISTFLLLLVVSNLYPSVVFAEASTALCHEAGSSFILISVDDSAYDSHIAHGDSLISDYNEDGVTDATDCVARAEGESPEAAVLPDLLVSNFELVSLEGLDDVFTYSLANSGGLLDLSDTVGAVTFYADEFELGAADPYMEYETQSPFAGSTPLNLALSEASVNFFALYLTDEGASAMSDASQLTICFDYGEASLITESNEENNCMTIDNPFYVDPADDEGSLFIDLSILSFGLYEFADGTPVDSFELPELVDPSAYIFVYELANIGRPFYMDEASVVGNLAVYAEVDDEETLLFIKDLNEETDLHDNLNESESLTFTLLELTTDYEDNLADYEDLTVCIDYGAYDQITEPNEENNCMEIANPFYFRPGLIEGSDGIVDLTISSFDLLSHEGTVSSFEDAASEEPSEYMFAFTAMNIGESMVSINEETIGGVIVYADGLRLYAQTPEQLLIADGDEPGLSVFFLPELTGVGLPIDLDEEGSEAEDVLDFSDTLSSYAQLTVCIDYEDTNAILESNEENNCMTIDNPFYLAPSTEALLLPDLIISSMTYVESNTLHFVFQNQGTAAVADELHPTLHIKSEPFELLSSLDLDSVCGTAYKAIGASMSCDIPAPFTIVSGSEVKAHIDATDLVAELKNDNNTIANTFTFGSTGTDSGSSSSSSGSTATESNGGGGVRGGSSHGGSSSNGANLDGSEEVTLSSEEEDACGEMQFADIGAGNAHYDAVYQLWCEDVIHGRTPTYFIPWEAIRRDEATKVVARLFGFVTTANADIPTVSETSYGDVSEDESLAYYIEVMTELGFFEEELAAGEFRPHDFMTASELSELITEVSEGNLTVDETSLTTLIRRDKFMDMMLELFNQ